MYFRNRINRRDFLTALGAVPAVAGSVLMLGSSCRGSGQRVSVGRDGLIIDGRVLPLYSGAVRYWNHERARWPELLNGLSRMGLSTLGLEIPWSLHERTEGGYDFGSGSPELDLDAFLDLASENGIRVIAGPGPALGPGIAFAGIPSRVLFDSMTAARDSAGNMRIQYDQTCQFPLPSFFSRTFNDEIGLWFDGVAPILSRHLLTRGGPVAAVQVGWSIFQSEKVQCIYSLDYSPAALESFSRGLTGTYADIGELNGAWGSEYATFETVEPPRSFDAESPRDLPRHLDWVEFRESSAAEWLNNLGSMLIERGIDGVPVFAVLSPASHLMIVPPAAEKKSDVSLAGFVRYASGPSNYNYERRIAKEASGISPFPFRCGLSLGTSTDSRGAGVIPEEFEFMSMTAVMQGIRGLSFHLAAECDNWTGAPFTRDCRVRGDYYEPVRRVLRFLRESRLHEYARQADIIVLSDRGLDSLTAALEHRRDDHGLALGGEVFNETVDLGLSCSLETCALWLDQAVELMRETGFDWDCGNSAISLDRLAQYKIAILSCGDFIYRQDADTLSKFVAGGGVLVFGPGRPFMDQSLHRNLRIESFFSGAAPLSDYLAPAGRAQAVSLSLIQMESPHEVGRLIKTLGISPRFTRSNTSLDLSVFSNREGRALLFVANSSDRPQKSDIFFQGRLTVSAYGQAESSILEGSMAVEIAPRSIAVWEVRA
jgi:beta-galactosidase